MSERARRVLLVEDAQTAANLVDSLLRCVQGHLQVTAVSTLAAALTTLSTDPPDVVLLDLNLPDSEGLATLVELRLKAPRVPVVVLTFHDERLLIEEAFAAGAKDFLTKPPDRTLLVKSLLYVLAADAREKLEEEFKAVLEGIGLTRNEANKLFCEPALSKSVP